MARFFKKTLRSILKRINYRIGDYRIAESPRSEIGGFDFREDIKLLIDHDQPVCLDVGANEGQTIIRLRKIFKNPIIHAFEPSSESFDRLRAQNYGPDVHLHHFALGSENSRREFVNYRDSCFSSMLELDPGPDNPCRNHPPKSKEIVEVRTVDVFVQQNQIARVDLLKVDTQGYDLEVLKGAEETLTRGLIDNVFIEINFVPLYRNQSDPREISDLLSRHGFNLVDYYDKTRNRGELGWCNALYTKKR